MKKPFASKLRECLGEDGLEYLESRGYDDEVLSDICAVAHMATRWGYDIGYETAERLSK